MKPCFQEISSGFSPEEKNLNLEFLSVSVGERTIQVPLEDLISGAASPGMKGCSHREHSLPGVGLVGVRSVCVLGC